MAANSPPFPPPVSGRPRGVAPELGETMANAYHCWCCNNRGPPSAALDRREDIA
jgi:hypothetical protein